MSEPWAFLGMPADIACDRCGDPGGGADPQPIRTPHGTFVGVLCRECWDESPDWSQWPDGHAATCRHCGEPIRRTTMDDAVPWVHLHSHNGHYDVTSPESAVLSSWANWTGLRDVAEPA